VGLANYVDGLTMANEKPVTPVNYYGADRHERVNKVTQLPTYEEQLKHYKAWIEQLIRDHDRVLSQYQRLRDVVKWEVEFWEQGLLEQKWTEGPTALRRRLSLLRGALAFRGVAEWAQKKQEK
jgi:hypothetical protein